MAGEYKGSQALAQIGGGNESVNRNTGSVNFSHTLVSLRGIVGSINLQLAVTYSAGLGGSFGLPKNWTLSIPFVVPGKSVTTRGRTYAIDPDWYDGTGYYSGLKYVNNHGMKFEPGTGEPLPSGRAGSYAWRFRMTDGACDYYDAQGKIIEHADVFGNFIYYAYVDPQASPTTALLDYIEDSWGKASDGKDSVGNKVRFQYDLGSLMRITAPDGAQTDVVISGQGIERITDPMGYQTAFQYTTVSSQTALTIIQYPSTLQARFEYMPDGMRYLDQDGNPQTTPAVQDHYHLDGNGAVLSHTNYVYGEQTGEGSYTGYSAYYRFGGPTDTLVESNNLSYRYDTRISNISPAGKPLSATRIFFNYLHLPMEEHHYDVGDQGQFLPAYKSLYAYDILDFDRHTQSPYYSHPTATEQLHYTGSDFQGLRRVNMKYDAFCSVLETDEAMWNADTKTYVPQRRTTNTYQKTSWGGQLLQSETFADEVSGFERRIQYQLTDDQKQVKSAQVSFKTKGDTDYRPWKTKSMAYDGRGRVISETVAWTVGVSVPEGTVASYTNRMGYQYDTQGFDIVTHTDPQGHAAVSKYHVKARNGPLVSKSLPLGQNESFTYDKIGRCVTYTDPFGKTTSTSYAFGSAGNSVTTTNSLGYVIRRTYDLHGKEIEVRDNGDPTQTTQSTPNRILSQSSYDSLSRVVSSTDIIGLRTTYGPYDAFNRLLSTTDPEGNVERQVHDDRTLSSQRFLNNDLRETTQLDAFSRVISTTTHPDSGDASADYLLVTEKIYDGSDNVVQTKLVQRPRSGGDDILLSSTSESLNVESAVVTSEASLRTDLADNAYDKVRHEARYDLFGQIYSRSKTVVYHGESNPYEYKSAVNIYDDCNLLVTHRNQIGKEEKYAYDANGHMSSMTRFDGSVVRYETDALGRTVGINTSDPSQSSTTSYLVNGLVATRETAAGILRYKYSLDGSPTTVEYPDGSKQAYTTDRHSRIAKSIDARGREQVNTFDDSRGAVASRALGPVTISYRYGEVNHTKGLPSGYRVTGSAEDIDTAIEYDGYGRVSRTLVTNLSNKVVLETKLSYTSEGKLQQSNASSEMDPKNPELNYQRHFLYDGLGQLRKEVVTVRPTNDTKTTEFAYDGNSNLISITVNGVKETRSYNAIDQLTSPGVEYDANGRQTKDDRDRTYIYNANDQLAEVHDAGQSVRFAYHPDGSMSQHIAGPNTTKLYYDCGSVNMATTQNGTAKSTSYLLAPASRVSTYTGTADEATVSVESESSTSLTLGKPPSQTTHSYSPFGGAGQGPAPGNDDSFYFGYHQELTDKLSGLVYLRSRFYQPAQASFLTMDSLRKDNRYAFCEGDPINRADPTGHSPTDDTATKVGLMVGIGATAVLAVATAGLGASLFGAETVAASVFVGAVSGGGGTLAGDAATAAVAGQSFSFARGAEDVFSGMVGGIVGGWAGTAAGDAVMAAGMVRGWSQRAVTQVGLITSGFVGGAAGGVAGAVSADVATGQSPFSSETAISGTVGALLGAAGGIHGSLAWLGFKDPGIMPVKVTVKDLRQNLNQIVTSSGYPMGRAGPQRFEASATQGQVGTFHRRLDALWAGRQTVGRDVPTRVAGLAYDTFAIQGRPGIVFPQCQVRGQTLARPMKPALLAEYLDRSGWANSIHTMKLTSAYGGQGTAQEVANALRRPVWAPYGVTDVVGDAGDWALFHPQGAPSCTCM